MKRRDQAISPVADGRESSPRTEPAVSRTSEDVDLPTSPCLDARGFEGWTCRTHDGTGLWCVRCLRAEIESLRAEVERSYERGFDAGYGSAVEDRPVA